MPRLSPPCTTADHSLNRPDAALHMLEFADFQCPWCREAYFILKDLMKEIGDEMQFAFRHHPLTQIHPEAMNAALIAEFAGTRRKFWYVHAMLFENQAQLGPDLYAHILADIEETQETFEAELAKGYLQKRISNDLKSGTESKITGTPAIFIEDYLYEGELTLESILSAVWLARG